MRWWRRSTDNADPTGWLPVTELLVGAAFFALAYGAIALTRVAGGVALIWPANAFAAALLIRLPRVRWYAAAAALLVAGIAANLAAGGHSLNAAVALSGVNLLEMALVVNVFRFVHPYRYPDLSIGDASVMTAVMGVALPGLAAVMGAGVAHSTFGAPYLPTVRDWWISDMLGACLFGPPVILFSVKGWRRLADPAHEFRNVMTVLVCLASCYLAIQFVRFPFIAIGVVLLIAAFRFGGFGTSLLSLVSGLEIIGLWSLGLRPIGLEAAHTSSSLAGIPILALLATTMAPIAVGLGTDARREMGRALRLAERRFRDSITRSPIGMFMMDLKGTWTYTNPALQQMLGMSEEECRARAPSATASPQEQKEIEQRLKRLLDGEIDSYDITRQFRHKDRSSVWVHVAVSLVRDDEGAPLHFVAQVESIEARRRAEEIVAQERERLRITLQSIDDAVITTDAEQKITFVNPSAERLLGIEAASAVRRHADEVLHLTDPSSARRAANLIGQSLVHGTVVRRPTPCLLQRPDGSVCYVSDVVTPVLDPRGIVSGLVIVLRDATEEFERTRELAERATTDPLTGLANRAEFDRRLQAAFQRTLLVQESAAAVLAIDLDLFKSVNDSGGHAAGDAVLRGVAEACRSQVRASDVVARLGGDEFAVLLDNCPEDRAVAVARELTRILNPLETPWAGATYSTGASIGVAVRGPRMARVEDWLAAADAACYAAKRDGRGTFRVAPSDASTTVDRLQQLAS